jgi:hypothetical protein
MQEGRAALEKCFKPLAAFTEISGSHNYNLVPASATQAKDA